jgi:hypothetical protein
MVRTKFLVESQAQYADGSFKLSLRAVYSGSEENKAFFKATPGGQIEMSTVNPAAGTPFVPGKEFYVDFTPAVEGGEPGLVRAKFAVNTRSESAYGFKVDMTPVYSGSDENKAFFKATPNGNINLGTIVPEAVAQFVPGKEFYVDFTPAEADP